MDHLALLLVTVILSIAIFTFTAETKMVIPLEILYNILELCPRDVLLNTCMVSRGAHRTSVPLLCQEFAPDRPRQMVLFFKTILRNPGLGKYVESVFIRCVAYLLSGTSYLIGTM